MRHLAVCFTVVILLVASVTLVSATDGVRAVIEPTEREGLEVWLDKDCYEPGSYLTIHFKADRSGYLTIYSMSPDGDTSVLFPNAYYSDNYIQGGVSYSLPSSSDPFKIRVEAPSVVLPDAKEIIWGVITAERITLPPPDGRGQIDLARAVRSQVLSSTVWWASDRCEFGYGPCEEDGKGETYALFVAISDYANDRNDLDYPISQNIVNAYKKAIASSLDHVKTLNNAQATRSDILRAIKDFLGQAGENDTVYFHFVGHGYHVKDEDGDEGEDDGYDEVIVPYDGNYITDDELHASFANLDAKWAVLIFESCYSGTAHRGDNVLTLYPPMALGNLWYQGGSMIDDFASRRGRTYGEPKVLALEACSPDQGAIYWNKPDGLSLFAKAMILVFNKYQEAADTNNDGWVSFQEAFSKAAPLVEDAATKAGREQNPMMFDAINESVNVVEVD